ncbi:uncharacterized protein LOC108106084 [Drosophila eugracilis]|uniref:uncharacterized protein LOC108106084 n=1 Tax=Drosophila eugracilis TaxID=29029 RepID=UPI001BDA463F|nr:uncharacterized protein LOC108106084 [Drosophila eugracilis]
MLRYICFFLLSCSAFEAALACNGYKAKLVKMENCAGDDAIMTVGSDFNLKLNKKCELVPSGCISNKPFGTAVAKFKVQKDGIVMKEGKIDLCAAIDQASSEGKDMLKLFGAPSTCPVGEEKVCANEHTVDLSKYKAMLGMARGHLIIDAEIKHDTGKSCLHAEIELTKN